MNGRLRNAGRDDTRDQLLAAAHHQFAERGFYGASIAQIAGEVGLTKQALLYHFKRKEDLYAEVLRGISRRLEAKIQLNSDPEKSPEEQLVSVFLGLHAAHNDHPLDTRILMRELLDNQARAQKARDWYLKPFLDQLVSVFRQVPAYKDMPFADAFATIYQLLGIIEYFAISEPTLRQMYGDDDYNQVEEAYPEALRRQIRFLIDCVNGC